jgi:hypothetical protein
MTTTPTTLVRPTVNWAIEPEHFGTIAVLDGVAHEWPTLPLAGDVFTVAFLVDPRTKLPCPVQVTRVEDIELAEDDLVVAVVAPASGRVP